MIHLENLDPGAFYDVLITPEDGVDQKITFSTSVVSAAKRTRIKTNKTSYAQGEPIVLSLVDRHGANRQKAVWYIDGKESQETCLTSLAAEEHKITADVPGEEDTEYLVKYITVE